LKINIKKNYF